MTDRKRSSLPLTPNEAGEIIDRQCPECGAWASEHLVFGHSTIALGVHTMEEMRAVRPQIDHLECPR